MTIHRGQFLENGLPSAPEAEETALGAVILENTLISQLANILEPDDFHSPVRKMIYEAMLELFRTQKPIDAILIANELEKRGWLERVGGVTTITKLTFGLPPLSNLTRYIEIILEYSRLRKLIKFHNRQIAKAMALEDSQRLAEETIIAVRKFQTNGKGNNRINQKQAAGQFRKDVEEWADINTKDLGIITGIPEFDKRLGKGEFAAPDLIFLCASHGVGKSLWLKQITKLNAKRGKKILYCSFEMPPKQLIKKMLPDVIGVPHKEINKNTVRYNEEKRAKILRGIEVIEDLPIFYESNCRNDEDFRATVHYYKQFHGIDAVCVDYLQLMNSKGRDNKNYEYGQVSKVLKETALDCHLPIICAAQSITEGGKHKIRDTGEAVKHADDVWFIVEDGSEKDGTIQVKILTEKHRAGDKFFINLSCEKDYQRLMSATNIQDEDDAGGFEFCCQKILEEGL